MRGLVVTGTGTGVGKTVLSAALVAAMTAAGESVTAHKPVLTGTETEPIGPWPADHELLGSLAGQLPEQVAPLRFGPAVSPHFAAELAGRPVSIAELLAGARLAASRAGEGVLLVEGAGGLLAPLAEECTVRDLARELGLGLVVAARAGLGTINHVLLTLEAARAAGLQVRGVVLTPWPMAPSPMERSNHETIARLGEVDVHVLQALQGPDHEALARAGATLPWRAWIAAEAASASTSAAPGAPS